MTNEEKNNLILQFITSIAGEVNGLYSQLIDDKKIELAKGLFLNSFDDYEVIIQKISGIIENLIEDRKNIIEDAKPVAESELAQFTLDLGINKTGVYLSQLQIDLLMITEISSIEELNDYINNCSQFSNTKLEDIIGSVDSIDLESMKRKIYDAYVAKLDTYIEETKMTMLERAKSKVEKMGLSTEEKESIVHSFEQVGLNETIRILKESKGQPFIEQLNRLMKDDFENVSCVSYDTMVSLSKLIDRDNSIDTIIIATSKYNNCMFLDGTSKYYDPYYTERALKYCEKHNLHMRFHALLDYVHLEKLIEEGKSFNDKEEILKDLKTYIALSMQFIEEHNKVLSDGAPLINVVEVFNELVEKNKIGDDKNHSYEMKWEKEFGITVEDLIHCFDGIKKPSGISFMYNETTLTESKQKRDKVESVLGKIEAIAPGFIDEFGDQSHLDDDDLKNGGIEIKETAEMLSRIQNGEIRTGIDSNGNYILTKITPKKIEMTEHDFHFTAGYIGKVKDCIDKGIIEPESFQVIKKHMQDKIAKLYKSADVEFSHLTYWTIIDENDHNLVRANKKIINENEKNHTNNSLLDNMYAGVFYKHDIDKVVSLGHQPVKKNNDSSSSFSKRSEEEIAIADNIRKKNKAIALEKQSAIVREKGPSLVKKANNVISNNGFTNLLVLSLALSFISISLSIFAYFIVK